MSQYDLFDSNELAVAQRLDLPDGDAVLYPSFLTHDDADRLLAALDETVIWRQERVRMFGRESPIPRLTAWYGDPGLVYTYSKIAMAPEPWTEPLTELKERAEGVAAAPFNSVLSNLYRWGEDGVAWHSDDETELGPDPVIASVSLGQTRKFQFRHVDDTHLRREVELTHGSLLVMSGATQRRWRHQVPKTSKSVRPRINLTFRRIG